jgi:DNA-binding GntR family transcriptional regulator
MQDGIPNGTSNEVRAKMAASKSEPLIDSVYSRLRDLILSNVLRAGQKLVDRDLAEQLGVSRTPVREALGRLAMMGLVEARSRRGYYVRQYTAEEMSDLYEFRQILEVNAAKLAAKNATPSQMSEFADILIKSEELAASPANHAKTVKLDLEIHDLIARASGNASLHQSIQNLMDKVMCFIWVDWVDASVADPVSIAAAHEEHQGLIKRIIARDADGAAERLGAHIDGAREGLAAVLKARDELRSVVLAGTSFK